LALSVSGRTASEWANFPTAMARGDAGFIRDWPVAQLVDTLQKLCHDTLANQLGAPTRFFDPNNLKVTGQAGFAHLTEWSVALVNSRRTIEHPFNAGLMQEALVERAQSVLNSHH
jgi:DNA polymerase-3 subunit delta'